MMDITLIHQVIMNRYKINESTCESEKDKNSSREMQRFKDSETKQTDNKRD